MPSLYLPDKNDIPRILADLVNPNDLTVFLGAGDIRDQGVQFVKIMRMEDPIEEIENTEIEKPEEWNT